MRRSLVACVALLLGCEPAQPEADSKARTAPETPAKPGDPKAPAKGEPPTKQETPAKPETPTKQEAPAKPEAPVTPPAEPAKPAVVLPAATTALLDRLVPAADRVTVDEAVAKRLTVEVVDYQLWVVDGSRRAPLDRRGDTITNVGTVTGTDIEPKVVVLYEDAAFCGDTHQEAELPARALLARIEHAVGLEHYGKGNLEPAAKGFAQAALLEPSLDDAWLGLARTLAKQSDTASAMAALEPMLGRAPFQTYHHVLSEPELASLREQPAIVALRAPKAGDVKIRKLSIAHSAHHSLVALVRTEDSWGACNFEQDLRLYSSKTGEQVLSIPLATMSETDPECEGGHKGKVLAAHRKLVNARFDHAERFLRDLGFSVSPKLELVDPQKLKPEQDEIKEAALPGAGLDVVVDEKSVSVRKGSEVLATKPQDSIQSIDLVGHDPVANVVFVEWWQQVPEGCAFEGDGRGYYVLPVPAAP